MSWNYLTRSHVCCHCSVIWSQFNFRCYCFLHYRSQCRSGFKDANLKDRELSFYSSGLYCSCPPHETLENSRILFPKNCSGKLSELAWLHWVCCSSKCAALREHMSWGSWGVKSLSDSFTRDNKQSDSETIQAKCALRVAADRCVIIYWAGPVCELAPLRVFTMSALLLICDSCCSLALRSWW